MIISLVQSERDLQPISDEQKILRYVTSTQAKEIRNSKDLFDRLSRLFNKDLIYIESIWSGLERENTEFIGQITAKFKDEVLKQHYERAQFGALCPKAKHGNNIYNSSEIVSNPLKPAKDDENLNIKDIK